MENTTTKNETVYLLDTYTTTSLIIKAITPCAKTIYVGLVLDIYSPNPLIKLYFPIGYKAFSRIYTLVNTWKTNVDKQPDPSILYAEKKDVDTETG